MRLKFYIFVVLSGMLNFFGNTQTRIIDSLKLEVQSANTPAQKADALLGLCGEKYSLSADLLYRYAAEIKSFYTQPSDPGYIMAEYFTAWSLMGMGMEDSAIVYADKYLEMLKEDKANSKAYMLFFQLKGYAYYRINRPKQTVKVNYELAAEALKRKDTLSLLYAQRAISVSYLVNNQDREALALYHKAVAHIPLNSSRAYKEVYGFLKVNASISYLHLYQATRTPAYADSCEFYGKGVVKLGQEVQNLFILCQGLVVRGLILSYQNKMEEAEKSLLEGLEVRKIIGDTIYIISDMSVTGSFYANSNQPDKGISICKKGILLSEGRKNSAALKLLLYSALAENYKVNGDYKGYGETLHLLIGVKDSLNKKNSTEELKALQSQYDIQENKKLIAEQELVLLKKNYWLYGSALLALMVSIIVWLSFNTYHRRQKIKLAKAREEEKGIAANGIIQAEENERKRIAADLHDNIGAYASAIRADVEKISYDNPAKNSASIQNLQQHSQEIINSLRDTIWVLNKENITITGMGDRMKNYINKLQPSYSHIQIEVSEQITNDLRLGSQKALNIFRLVQEAIHNALRHSGASQINLVIKSDDKISIQVTDNGTGLTSGANPDTGHGLQNMKTRAEESGFIFEMGSLNGVGTSINIIQRTPN
ncbi:MAG: histidine kinase [Ginsengibacter sp.]